MPAPLTVAHLIDANLDTSFFRALVAHRDRTRFEVMVGSLAPAGALQGRMQALGAPTFSLSARGRAEYALAVLRLVRLLRRGDVAILHAHCFDPTLVGLMAARLARVPFVFTRHHSDHNIRLGKKWHTRLDGFCARRADRAIAVSEATRKIMLDVEGARAANISVVYNGIEALEQPRPACVTALRGEFAQDGACLCLVLARLHEEKGHLVLFDALPRLRERVGAVRVLLAGEGPHGEWFEREARARGLGECVRFLGRRADVADLIGAADVVVLPSLAESFGFVLVEAMSLGKPVVGTTTGGVPEVVRDGETGLLVPPGDASALAVAIARVLESPDWARTLAEAGRTAALRFTAEAMVRGYERVYEELLAAKTVSRG
jgi:glycosyltransferase involved in cell wall biosynthesis